MKGAGFHRRAPFSTNPPTHLERELALCRAFQKRRPFTSVKKQRSLRRVFAVPQGDTFRFPRHKDTIDDTARLAIRRLREVFVLYWELKRTNFSHITTFCLWLIEPFVFPTDIAGNLSLSYTLD